MNLFKDVDWGSVGVTIAERAVALLVVIIVAWVVLRILRWAIHRAVLKALDREAVDTTTAELSAVERRKRIETLEGFLLKVARLVVVIVAILVILAAWGMLAVLASLSLLGAALAFAGQNVIRDYVNGVFILVENQFAVGDVVRIAGVAGSVEDVSLRRTTLRDLDGVVHVVPNGSIVVASNMTRTWARVNEDILVGYGTDIDRAIAAVDAIGVAMAAEPVWRRRILEAPKVLRVEALGEYGITLKVLGTVRAADQWEAAGELRRRVLDAFRAEGIEIPFPTRVVVSRDAGADEPGTDGPDPAVGGASEPTAAEIPSDPG
jgi:small-conductance mechanosensitive channel